MGMGRELRGSRLGEILVSLGVVDEVVSEPAGEGWYRDAVAHGVVPGVRLAELLPDDPMCRGQLLVTVTECNSLQDIDALVTRLANRRAA